MFCIIIQTMLVIWCWWSHFWFTILVLYCPYQGVSQKYRSNNIKTKNPLGFLFFCHFLIVFDPIVTNVVIYNGMVHMFCNGTRGNKSCQYISDLLYSLIWTCSQCKFEKVVSGTAFSKFLIYLHGTKHL